MKATGTLELTLSDTVQGEESMYQPGNQVGFEQEDTKSLSGNKKLFAVY